MKKSIDWRELGLDTLYDIAGSILFAVGVYTFALHAGFAPAGISGVAIIINYYTKLPLGTMSLLLNVPIILITFRILGRDFLIKSFRTMVISALILDGIFPHFPAYEGSPLLAALFCGVFSGAGLALIYLRSSSTGGTDFLVLSGKKLWPHLSIGQLTMLVDGLVIVAGGLVFGNIDAVLYGIISTFLTTLVIDQITLGIGRGKVAMIITDHGGEIARMIDQVTGRGSTLIPVIGTYSGQPKQLILCASSKTEIIRVRAAAHTIDPKALVIICESNEVFGEGFQPPDLSQSIPAPEHNKKET